MVSLMFIPVWSLWRQPIVDCRSCTR